MVNQMKDRAEDLHQLIVVYREGYYKQKDRQQTVSQYIIEIEGLWELLQTPREDMDSFLASYTASISNDAIAYVELKV